MNNDFLRENPLAQMDYRASLLFLVATLAVVYGIAWFYRNDYEVAKPMKAYGRYALLAFLVSRLVPINLAMLIGLLLMGLIILAFRSNHYFYD